MVEEVLHIAVNTPQIYDVPKSQRPRLLAILKSYLQKRVMQFLQGSSNDPEELSHRQLEANKFRSTVMKQVYRLLREEQEREMSMSSTVMNGFEYYFQENANPFNDTIEKRWEREDLGEIEVSPITDEFEAKRKRINDEYLNSLLHPTEKLEPEKDEEEEEEIGKVMLYTNLKDLISVNDPSVRRYPDEVGVDVTGDAEFSLMLKEMKDENELFREMNEQMDEIEGVERGASGWNGGENGNGNGNGNVIVKEELNEEEEKGESENIGVKVEGNGLKTAAFEENEIRSKPNESNKENEPSEPSNPVKSKESNDSKESKESIESNKSDKSNNLNEAKESVETTASNPSHPAAEAKETTSAGSPSLTESTSPPLHTPLSLTPIPGDVEEDNFLFEVSNNGDITVKRIPETTEAKTSEQEEHVKSILEASTEQLQQIRKDLSQKYRHFSSQNAYVSENIIIDIVEILSIFGIPYVFAPGEAEAQCAFLDLMGLVDGVISNDSDVFAFGGKTVYRNFFVDNRFVEVYKIEDVEKERGLNRDRIIELALLLGCDYCEVGECSLFKMSGSEGLRRSDGYGASLVFPFVVGSPVHPNYVWMRTLSSCLAWQS